MSTVSRAASTRLQNGNGLYSQASNFPSHVTTGVDPRTGQFTLALELPIGAANNLAGPSISASLAFSSLGSAIDRGFGRGWSLAMSELNLISGSLRLSTGEQYAVDMDLSDFSRGGALVFFDQKLMSFRVISQDGEGKFAVEHKSGDIEILQLQGSTGVALPVQILSPEGRSVFVEWLPAGVGGGSVLYEVRDESRTLLRITPDAPDILIQSNPDSAVASTITLVVSTGRLSAVILPDNSHSQWEFDYTEIDGLLFPIGVKHPHGSVDDVLYASGPNGHHLPQDAPLQYLARVTTWLHTPGPGLPVLNRTYEWVGQQNFLGFGAALPGGWEDGKDNLYQVGQAYSYSVSETLHDARGAKLSVITRSWNRFHLQTEEMASSQSIIQRIYTEYDENPALPWQTQPAWCQLPWKVITEYEDLSQPSIPPRREETETRYDEAGNILYFRDASGVVETREYYPAGYAGPECPADPLGFTRWTSEYRVEPALLEDGTTGGAPTLVTTYRYALLPSLVSGFPAHVVVTDEFIGEATATGLSMIGSTSQTFIQDGSAHHGRPLTSISTLNGISTTTGYRYELANDQLIMHTTVTGFENDEENTASQVDARSVFTGLTVMQQDYDGVVEQYTHDVLGRIVSKTVAPDTDYEVTMTCRYQLAGSTRALDVQVEETDAHGVRKRLHLDGDGRTLRTEVEDRDNAPGIFREVLSTRYNALGQIEQETSQDWLPSQAEPISLTTRYEYDGWGNRTITHRADGTRQYSVYDPVTLEGRQWTQSVDNTKSVEVVTCLNGFGSVIRSEQLHPNGGVVFARDVSRDGLDRVITQSDIVPLTNPIITRTRYDLQGRVSSKTLPDNTVVNWTYAAHSDDDHRVSVEVMTPQGAKFLLGTKTYDGLGRDRSVAVGGRQQLQLYTAGQMPPVSSTTSRGDSIAYQYQKHLNNQLTRIDDGTDQCEFTYTPHDAQLLTASGGLGEMAWTYTPAGKPESQTWTIGQEAHSTSWRHSLSGLPVSFTDVSGVVYALEYDASGRLAGQSSEALTVTFAYDGFSRLQSIVTRDLAQNRSLTQTLDYDALGREMTRTISSSEIAQAWTQELTYTARNQVQSRRWRAGALLLSHETYAYDTRGRLLDYTTEGPNSSADPFGNVLRSQAFTLNALDGYETVVSVYADGTQDNAVFTYSDADPTQIKQVTHTHTSWPKLIEPSYDAHGNVTRDGLGRELTWDAQDRLVSVTEGVRTAEYRYDPLGQLGEVILDSKKRRLFYQADTVANERDAEGWRGYLSAGRTVLAISKLSEAVHQGVLNRAETVKATTSVMLLGADAQGSVRLEVDDSARMATYSPHGFRSGDAMQGQPGFAGERQDELTGWYMPGSYRPYDPVLMSFLSPDSESPFGAGGLNAYAYCAGDPINNIDPDGHAWWKWLVAGVGTALAIAGTVASFGTAAPALAALWAGGMGALTLGGAMAITSAGFAAVSLATGVAAMTLEATGGDEKAAGILGWVSLGTGVASAVTGLASGLAAKAAARATRAAGRGSIKAKGPKSSVKGKLIFEEKTGKADVATHDNLWDRGIQAYETHGDRGGNLMDASGKYRSATTVATKDIRPWLDTLPYREGEPIILIACWGGKSGAAQKVANVIRRPVFSFDHTVVIQPEPFMGTLRVSDLARNNLLKSRRSNPFAIALDRLRGIPKDKLAAMRLYYPQ
jgi:RHS repeat-associated protein